MFQDHRERQRKHGERERDREAEQDCFQGTLFEDPRWYMGHIRSIMTGNL